MYWSLLVFGILTNAIASILIKLAVSGARKIIWHDPITIFTNWPLWIGLFLYFATFIIYAVALSKFPLNVAHPIFTAGAILAVAILSVAVLEESLIWTQMLGVVLVISGVVLISSGAK